ncbi:MAG: preprotein translocase subunit SecG [Ruminococcus sp.]|nr:preprotein translocase subunit SecG [Ruminococcus sp.]
MSTLEIIAGVLLLLSGLIIILVVLAQETKEQGLTSAIGGGANDSFYEHNMGRTKDAKLSKFTRNAAIVMFIVTLAVNIFATVGKNDDSSASSSGSTSTVSTVSEDTSSEATESTESTAESAADDTAESTESTAE